jgi:hypothetical protein
LFPDEFLLKEVLRELERLRRDKPDVLSLVVTRDPDRYLTVTDVKGNGHVRIVIPKPAWGWTILDAIRAGLESPSELGGPCEQ